MPNEDGTVWITYNGEVYNHRALRAELEAKGHVYRSPDRHRDDPPPLRGGRTAVRRAPPRHVRVRDLGRAPARALPRARPARDQAALLRAATRRLRLRLRDQGASAASAPRPPISTSRRSHHYLTFVATPAPRTMFAGISKLRPAERMVVSADGSMTSEIWWTPVRTERRRRDRRLVRAGARVAVDRPPPRVDPQADDGRRARSASSSRAASTRRRTSR